MVSASTILGHHLLVESLKADHLQGNVAHAYLFEGPRHVGKFTVAKWFAMELLSTGVPSDERPRVQHEVDRLIHSDILVIDQLWMEDVNEDFSVIAQSSNIQQEHRKKAKAKTDTISIDDIRAVQDRLHEIPNGKYRCCLIRSVERMQAEAVNALLKILEEPPQGLVFLLSTESLSSLLPTLLSRVRLLRFSRLESEEMSPLFQDVSDDDRLLLLHIAQGAPGTVKRLLESPEELRKERTLHANAALFWRSRSFQERLKLLAPLHDKSGDGERMLLHLALALRETIAEDDPAKAECFFRLLRGMEPNTHKQLLAQRLALSLEAVQ